MLKAVSEFTLIDGCNNTHIDTHIVDVVDTIGPVITFIPPIPVPVDCKALVVCLKLSQQMHVLCRR